MAVNDHTRVGSVIKTFTGTAILQLVDQERIQLTDPISRYVEGVPSGDAITLDMLGRMRSGLFNYSEDEGFQQRLFAESPRMVSDHADTKTWVSALGRGTLLLPETQARRIQGEGAHPGITYGFTIFDTNGWIGHNGGIPGYATVTVYLPEHDATLVVFANSDAPADHSAGQLATAVTLIVTPDHIYNLAG